jgi:hypothetical protein
MLTALMMCRPCAAQDSTALTYQGRLDSAGAPVSGRFTLGFSLWSAPAGGVQVAGPITFADQLITEGLFSEELDFGAAAFNNDDRWLAVSVDGTPLQPRQKVTRAPYAIQTRGIFVNDDLSFVGVGRESAVTSSEVFGLFRNTSGFAGMYVETASSGEPFYGYSAGGDVDAYHYYDSASLQWRLAIGLDTRLVVDGQGDVGIGSLTPVRTLDISDVQAVTRLTSTDSANGSVLELRNSTGSIGDDIIGAINFVNASDGTPGQIAYVTGLPGLTLDTMGLRVGGLGIVELNPVQARFAVGVHVDSSTPPGAFNRVDSDGSVILIEQDGAIHGSITVSGTTVSYNPFTGSHFGWIDAADVEAQSIERGTLVSLTGNNQRHHGDDNAELIYGVAPSTVANDPRRLGAYLDLHDSAEADDDQNLHLIMAVGNGEMWLVPGAGGHDIQPGDYLISSGVRGCAMKDDSRRFPIGHIVARAAESVDWSDEPSDHSGLQRKRISVFFENFVRNSEADRLKELIESQQHRIESLEHELATIRSLTERLKRCKRNSSRCNIKLTSSLST